MVEEFISEKIPKEIVEKYGIGKERVLRTGYHIIKIAPCMKTPFTGYGIIERDGDFFVQIPRREQDDDKRGEVRVVGG